MLIAKESLELAIGSLKDFGHEVDIANDRFKAGDLGKLDFERLDLQLGDYESDESNDIITLRQASDQLQTVIGIEFPTEDFDITGTIIPPLVTQTKDQLVQAALTDRPDYAAAHFGVAAADASSCLAIVNGTGDPTLEAEYDRFGTYSSAGFSLNIPIRIFDRNQGNKATGRFQPTPPASPKPPPATRSSPTSIRPGSATSRSGASPIHYNNHYLNESKDVLSIAQYAFLHGGSALIDYLDTLSDARSATLDALNAYQQTWLAIHSLSAASATELVP